MQITRRRTAWRSHACASRTLNAQIREEACVGLDRQARDMLMAALGHMKGNLTLADEETAAAE